MAKATMGGKGRPKLDDDGPQTAARRLALRIDALRRSSLAPVARARDERLRAQSPVYRAVVGDPARLRSYKGSATAANGLTWWVPRREGTGDKFADRIAQGVLPWREMERTRALGAGGVMLDIGANIGTTSIPRVGLGDYQAAYCAEPEPGNYAALVENIEKNGLLGFVLPDRLAIADADGEASFLVSPFMGQHELTVAGAGKGEVVTVPTRTLDSWLAHLGVDPHDVTFVKTDCQGWDGHVLRGAADLLRHRHILWQIEYWPSGIERSSMSVRELHAIIAGAFTHGIVAKTVEPIATLVESLEAFAVSPGWGTKYTELILFNLA